MSSEDSPDQFLILSEALYAQRARWKALVQFLVDTKVIKREAEDVFEELDKRADDIMGEELRDARVARNAADLKLAWSKLPKQ